MLLPKNRHIIAANDMYGPNGISVLPDAFSFSIRITPKIAANIDEKSMVIIINFQPSTRPQTANSLTSPSPIPPVIFATIRIGTLITKKPIILSSNVISFERNIKAMPHSPIIIWNLSGIYRWSISMKVSTINDVQKIAYIIDE